MAVVALLVLVLVLREQLPSFFFPLSTPFHSHTLAATQCFIFLMAAQFSVAVEVVVSGANDDVDELELDEDGATSLELLVLLALFALLSVFAVLCSACEEGLAKNHARKQEFVHRAATGLQQKNTHQSKIFARVLAATSFLAVSISALSLTASAKFCCFTATSILLFNSARGPPPPPPPPY